MAWVKIRVPRTSQPQDTCGLDLAHPTASQITTVSVPAGNTLRNLAGNAWATNNPASLSDSVATFGKSVKNTSTGYFSRANTIFDSWFSGGIVFTPSTVVGTVGIWSLASSYNTGSNINFIIQRNGADLRVFACGAFKLTIAGVFTAGKAYNITWSVYTNYGPYNNFVASLCVNGRLYPFTVTGYNSVNANEYLLSGYNGQAAGDLGLFWSAPIRADDAQLVDLSNNPWQIFEPEELTIWIPDDAGTGGTDNLTPKDIALGAATLSKPNVGQSHILSGKSLNLLAADVTSPTIYQVHQLIGKAVSTAALTISKPVLVYVPITVDLVGRNISLSASTISNPALGQIHELAGSNLTLPGVILTKPVISQVHGFNAQGISLGEVTITKPELTSASNTDNLTAKSIALEALRITRPSIEQIHVLTGLDVNLDGLSITKSVIGQVHVLQVQPITLFSVVINKPELTSLANTDVLYPKDITLGALTVSNPAITQVHTLVGKSLVTGSVSIVKPVLRQVHGLTPKDINLGSWKITKPVLIIGGITEVYVDEILSDVVDDKVIVLLQDEVIQVNILSETI